MTRVHGTTAAVRWPRSRLATTLLAVLFVVTWLIPQTIASGELRAMRSAPAGVVAPPIETPSDDGVPVRHLVSRGETFASILLGRGLSSAEIRSWEQAAAGAYHLAAIQPGHAFLFTFARDQGQLTACEYEIDKHSLLSMRLVHGQIQARLKAMPQLAAVRGVAGRVEASLATSATAAGIPGHMVSELAEVFGWDVDLQADLQPGDRFRVLYAELRDEDAGTVRPGDILAAEITSGGRTLTAIRFENENGESDYYDLDGRPLGRPFLKYPVDFVTITSQFSGARMHPVLKRPLPHLGVDFAAPKGTPVHAVASGVVTFAGRNGRYGNQVEVEHETPYASSYSHLQRIAGGLRVGASVRKGQVIGYVGRSGMATGPHLHFMIFKNGKYVNPLDLKIAADEPLKGTQQKRFAALRGDLLARLGHLWSAVKLSSFVPPSVPGLLRPKAASYVE